jgi:hypothetical protein
MKLRRFAELAVIATALLTSRSGGTPSEASADSTTSQRGQLWIGLDVGSQLGSSYNMHPRGGFDSGIYLRLSLFEKPISDWGQFSLGASYWHGRTNRQLAQSDDGKGGDIQLLFLLLRAGNFTLSLGPRVGIEGVNHAQGAVFNAGVVLSANYPIADNWRIQLRTRYQMGGELFALGGGGYSYSFPAITIGIATNLEELTGPTRRQ